MATDSAPSPMVIKKKVKMADLKRSLMQPLQLNSQEAAAKVLERRAKLSQRWKADRSNFSALCLDVSSTRPDTSTIPEMLLSQRLPSLLESCKAPASASSTGSKCSDEVSTDGNQVETASQASLSDDSTSAQDFGEVRSRLLSFRHVAQSGAPLELANCSVMEVEASQSPKKDKLLRQQSEPVAENSVCGRPFMRQMSAVSDRTAGRCSALPVPSPKAYRPGQKAGPEADLKRTVQGLLNKICPENIASIVNKIAAVDIQEIHQLEAVIELMFKKAITEPHYCETYADLVFSLKAVYPAFASPDGGKPVTFKGLVLNICQNEFEELLASADLSDEEKAKCDEEDLEHLRKQRKDRMRANMKFIGHLFLRQLLSAKVIGTIICELVLCENVDMLPEDHALECACELLLAIGYTMENMAAGKTALTSACGRLKDLKTKVGSNGKASYCKRVQFMIQDVLDTRAAGWTRKVFKAAAKTKEEIRLDQEREWKEKAKGKDLKNAECVVTGQRPVYLSHGTGA